MRILPLALVTRRPGTSCPDADPDTMAHRIVVLDVRRPGLADEASNSARTATAGGPQQLTKIAALAERALRISECNRISGEDCFLRKVHVAIGYRRE